MSGPSCSPLENADQAGQCSMAHQGVVGGDQIEEQHEGGGYESEG